jgi:MYXO-CTERM domain-containing protein
VNPESAGATEGTAAVALLLLLLLLLWFVQHDYCRRQNQDVVIAPATH